LALAACLVTLTGATLRAQSGGGYDLSWSSIDGGGGTSANGGYELEGTIGQPDAGTLNGGAYDLDGGFWAIVVPAGATTCVGDCNNDMTVSAAELLKGIDIALGRLGLSACKPFDVRADGRVSIDELVRGVKDAQTHCP